MWPDAAVAFTAANGGAASAAVWSALAMHLSHVADARQTWPRMAAYVFTRLVEGQQANGSFLRTTPADNPETHWFHELVIAPRRRRLRLAYRRPGRRPRPCRGPPSST